LREALPKVWIYWADLSEAAVVSGASDAAAVGYDGQWSWAVARREDNFMSLISVNGKMESILLCKLWFTSML
jgi:hypothetical protein